MIEDYLDRVHGLMRLPDADQIRTYAERFILNPEELAKFLERAAENYVQARVFEMIRRDYDGGRDPPPEWDQPEGDDPWGEVRAYDTWDPLGKSYRTNQRGRWVECTEWEVLLGCGPGESAKRKDALYDLGSQVRAFWEDQPDGRRFRPKFEKTGQPSEPPQPINDAGDFLRAVFEAMDGRRNGSHCVSVIDGWRVQRRRRRDEAKNPPFGAG